MEQNIDSSFNDEFSNSYYSIKDNKLITTQSGGTPQEVDLEGYIRKHSLFSNNVNANLINSPIKFSSVLSGNNIQIHGGGKIILILNIMLNNI